MNGDLMGRPHVVILGAGASLAAFPNGDANGKRLPLMKDLVETLKLEADLEHHGVRWQDIGFEEMYSKDLVRPEFIGLRGTIEKKIYDYFQGLAIPGHPTLYDHMVLSMRSKDMIATFNWDPFLFDSWRRCAQVTSELPYLAYLHGNVRVGFCSNDRKCGRADECCPKCGRPYEATRLLYPVGQKDYTADVFVKSQWNNLKDALTKAYIVTVFGYAAPASDVEAIEMMKQGWGRREKRELEEIEIIDLKEEAELKQSWDAFICRHHYRVHRGWHESLAAMHPRRSCEAMWSASMEMDPMYPEPFPADMSLHDLGASLRRLLEAEGSGNGS